MTTSLGTPEISAGQKSILPLLAAVASITSVGIGISLMTPLLSLVLEAKGTSETWIGINTTFASLGAIVATFYTTVVARHLGVAMTMTLGPLITASLVISLYYIPSFAAWFPIRFLAIMGLTAHFILSEFWIISSASESRRGFWMAIYATSLSLGFAIGTVTLSIVGSTGFTPFFFCAILIALGALPALLARKKAPKLERDEKTNVLAHLFTVPMAIFAVLVFGLSESTMMTLMPLYGLATGHTEASASLLLSVIMIGGVAFQLPIGFLSDRMDRRKLLTLMAAIGFAGMMALPFAMSSFIPAAMILFLWGGITGGLYTVGLAHLGSRLSGNALVGANSAFILCYSIGMLTGPSLSGIALEIQPTFGLPAVSAAAFALFTIYALFRLKSQRYRLSK